MFNNLKPFFAMALMSLSESKLTCISETRPLRLGSNATNSLADSHAPMQTIFDCE